MLKGRLFGGISELADCAHMHASYTGNGDSILTIISFVELASPTVILTFSVALSVYLSVELVHDAIQYLLIALSIPEHSDPLSLSMT